MESGLAFGRNSLNQRSIKRRTERVRKFTGNDKSKAARAERRREERRIAHQRFLDNLPGRQFVRALDHAMNGGATFEEIDYVMRHIGDFERPLAGSEVTIVEFEKPEKNYVDNLDFSSSY